VNRATPLISNVWVAAGGLSYDADLEHVQVKNAQSGESAEINLIKLLKDNDIEQDLFLVPGDSVYVPKLASPLMISDEKYRIYLSSSFSPRRVPIKVIGYVNSPGLINLDTSQSLNLMSAISAAGGYLTDSAYSPPKVYVMRRDQTGKLSPRIVVNPLKEDITLMPNDIVYVPQKLIPRIGLMFDFLSRMAQPAFFGAAAYRNIKGANRINASSVIRNSAGTVIQTTDSNQ
ncbi:MAG: hypothetical protein K2X66_12105, partial [Cyanobacteria bacterium]|nr:hypothetical protein [Cyanobacteriota bacterium]